MLAGWSHCREGGLEDLEDGGCPHLLEDFLFLSLVWQGLENMSGSGLGRGVSITHGQGVLASDLKTFNKTDGSSDHGSLADVTDHFGFTLIRGY